MSIHAHPVAYLTAKQFVHRYVEEFALNVPERLLDRRNRAHANHAQAPERLPVEFLIDVLDAARILSDDHRCKILDGADNRSGLPFERSFSPTVQAWLICFDLTEHPVSHLSINDDRLEVLDLHSIIA